MMTFRVFAAAGLLLAVTSSLAFGQDYPRTAPPQMCLAQVDKEGGLVIQQSYMVHVPLRERVEVKETKIVDGKKVVKPKTVTRVRMVTEARARTKKLAKGDYEVSLAGGGMFDHRSLAKRLIELKPVLLWSSDKPLDKFYRQFFQADIPVIHLTSTQAKRTLAPTTTIRGALPAARLRPPVPAAPPPRALPAPAPPRRR